MKTALTGLSARVGNRFDGHCRRHVFRWNNLGILPGCTETTELLCCTSYSSQMALERTLGCFCWGKELSSLTKCDGCVKSPNLGHVQHTLSQQLEVVSAREHGVDGDSREQLWDCPRNVDQFPDKQGAPKATWRKPQIQESKWKAEMVFSCKTSRGKAGWAWPLEQQRWCIWVGSAFLQAWAVDEAAHLHFKAGLYSADWG